jgi:glycosyltransferase involved in cell wall biosynthesis
MAARRRRVAIVEYIMSAGGVERVLRGLASALLEIPEAADWEITFLLSRYNSAHHRCTWPAELTGPRLAVEWLGERSAAGRALDPLAHAQGLLGVRATRIPAYVGARLARRVGPRAWRAFLGDPYALVSEASRRFDLLYFTYPFWMAPPPMKAPVVTTPQDFNFKFFLPEGSRNRRVQERATRGWLEQADRVLLSSHAVESELRRFYPEHAHKAQVVHLGLDVGGAAPDTAELERVRSTLRLPPEFLLVSGWVVPHKNQLRVVEALRLLRERGRRLPVVFVGPNAAHLGSAPAPGFRGEYAERVRVALDTANLREGEDFLPLGYVSDPELRCLFRLATAYTLPSLYEGFGLPSLEAMLAGCPTIVSAIPPLQEQNDLLGGLVPTFGPQDASALADRIQEVLEDPAAARARVAQAAARIPTVYDWKRTARAYLAAFDEVLAGRSRPS